MILKKKIILFIVVSIVFICLAIVYMLNFYKSKEDYYQIEYDKDTKQKPVKSVIEINEILNSFTKVSFSQLSPDYLKYSISSDPKYKKLLYDKIYYQVKGKQIFKFLVGNFRVKDFLVRDKYFTENFQDINTDKAHIF